LRIASLHRPHRQAPQDGSDDPQAGGDERHDVGAGGGFPKKIVKEGSRPTARTGAGNNARRGKAGRPGTSS
jgi:hypothetical protein